MTVRPLRADGEQRTVPRSRPRCGRAAATGRMRREGDGDASGRPVGVPRPRRMRTGLCGQLGLDDVGRPVAALRLGGPPPRARRAPRLRRPARPHRHRPVRGRRRGRRCAASTWSRSPASSAAGPRDGEPRPGDRRGRARRLHGRGPLRRPSRRRSRRRPDRRRRAGPAALPLRRPAPAPDAGQPAPAGAGQLGHPRRPWSARGSARSRRRCCGRRPPRGPASSPSPAGCTPALLRAAPEPAARQAAADGRRLRPLLPDRPLPARRGPAGRPPVRVHPARRGGLLRRPGRRARASSPRPCSTRPRRPPASGRRRSSG